MVAISSLIKAALALVVFCTCVYPALNGKVRSVYQTTYEGDNLRPGQWQMIFEGNDARARNAEKLSSWAKEMYRKSEPLKGRVILVTGGNRGLGRGLVSHLAAWGATIVAPCRRCPSDFQSQVEQDAKSLRAIYAPETSQPAIPKLLTYSLDTGDMDSVDAFVDKLVADGVKVDALVNNAGAIADKYEVNKQGFETTFAINFVGTAQLTERLIETETLSKTGRIVGISSEDARMGRNLTEVLELTKGSFGGPWGAGLLDTLERYMFAKLMMTSYTINRSLVPGDQHTIVDMCPGAVATEVAALGPWPLNQIVYYGMQLIFCDPQIAALPLAFFAVDPSVKRTSPADHYLIFEKKGMRADMLELSRSPEFREKVVALLKKRGPLDPPAGGK